ncbi:MAG TPA: glycosyltransferase [Usitatibacter sp.]|jgi:lipopolysaccharide biosynthesis glycosyltransferase|nr:glycosyltransferase [Usitatibacter sp.]
MSPIRVFIGFDGREDVAFSVLAHSIHRNASQPVSIAPVMLSQLGGVYRRDVNPLQSTQFSFSRFLTPWLCGYEGWAVFMDCDMLVLDDIARLWALRDERYAVQVVKHVHVPKEDVKFLGAVQTKYEKKNWSSVMLMNCAKCTALTPEYVNTATGLQLHQFKWLEDDSLIGELPSGWNHLVGYDAPRKDASLVHYTIGGPYFEEYAQCEYAREWWHERSLMLAVDQRARAAKAS